jgi:hypothetical protein
MSGEGLIASDDSRQKSCVAFNIKCVWDEEIWATRIPHLILYMWNLNKSLLFFFFMFEKKTWIGLQFGLISNFPCELSDIAIRANKMTEKDAVV